MARHHTNDVQLQDALIGSTVSRACVETMGSNFGDIIIETEDNKRVIIGTKPDGDWSIRVEEVPQ